MNDLKNITINTITKKKSGLLYIGIGLIILIISIPLMLYGITKSSYNGYVYCFSKTSKNNRKEKKNENVQLKIDGIELGIKNQRLRKQNKVLKEVKNEKIIKKNNKHL